LKIGQIEGADIPMFVKSNNNTKAHIVTFFNGDEDLMKYIPDDIKINSITKSYLMSVYFFKV